MSMMEYKGYYGSVTYDDETGTFFGPVSNLQRDGITFEGSSVEELRAAFRESVDDYLAWCEKRGGRPRTSPTRESSMSAYLRTSMRKRRARLRPAGSP